MILDEKDQVFRHEIVKEAQSKYMDLKKRDIWASPQFKLKAIFFRRSSVQIGFVA